jgi:hypothetical protein
VGGYPEWLDYSEDLMFDMALREKNGLPFLLRKRPLPTSVRAAVYAPFLSSITATPGATAKPTSGRKRHLIRYLTYLVGVALHPAPHLA